MLEVPVLLPDSEPIHSREGRISDSQTLNTPDYRTMKPEDRFMNPRPPPQPKMPRLRSSLQQPAPAWTFNSSPLSVITNRTASLPASASGNSRSRGSRESIASRASRSLSPPRSRGLRDALHRLNASTPDLTAAHGSNDEIQEMRPGAAHGPRRRQANPRDDHSNRANIKGIKPPPLRPSSRNHESLTIQDRRALKSKPRDPSPFRNPLTVNTRSDRFETVFSQHNDVPSLRAIAQEIAVSGDSTTPTPFSFKDKRLPTLPNTPSSVMDEALRDLDDREKELDAENLGSHFSDFSATDESSGSHSPPCERSRFSEWSTDTEQNVSGSFNSFSGFSAIPEHPPPSPDTDDVETPSFLRPTHAAESSDPDTPHLTVNSQPSPAVSMPSDSPSISVPFPRVTVAGSPSEVDVSGLSIEDDAGDEREVETNPKRHAAFFGAFDPVKGLGLSPNAENFELLREAVQREKAATPRASYSGPDGHAQDRASGQAPGQSATMQEMLDELSYLKNMIQSEQGGMI